MDNLQKIWIISVKYEISLRNIAISKMLNSCEFLSKKSVIYIYIYTYLFSKQTRSNQFLLKIRKIVDSNHFYF